LVPVVEELFFRGFLFGAVERRRGGASAFVATTLIFAAAHLPQAAGAPGALAAVALLGLTLSAMRWWSGSVVAPALTHIIYNGSITIVSVASAALH
ncbi:MAG: CPBP family intramembrane glutamic endopeptidase, partial [Myxococcota bacterium]